MTLSSIFSKRGRRSSNDISVLDKVTVEHEDGSLGANVGRHTHIERRSGETFVSIKRGKPRVVGRKARSQTKKHLSRLLWQVLSLFVRS